MTIRVGFSADPDDAFMYWGIASGTTDLRGLELEPEIQDIQTLNEWARDGRLEVTALSAAAYPLVQDRYLILPHGASFGSGYGPIVVAREPLPVDELRELEIVVPGSLTTAFLVLRMAVGRAVNPERRDVRAPRPEDYVFEGYELVDALDSANATLEDDLTVSEQDGRGEHLRPFTRDELLKPLEAWFFGR